MRTLLFVVPVILALALLPRSTDAQPQEWELLQNDPNPFCSVTTIGFAAPQSAEIMLAVLSPDSSVVVRTLMAGLINPGTYTIHWDQTDDEGADVPNGVYPYQLIARDPELTGILFDAWLAATVACEVPTFHESWGRVKSRYRLEDDR